MYFFIFLNLDDFTVPKTSQHRLDRQGPLFVVADEIDLEKVQQFFSVTHFVLQKRVNPVFVILFLR